MELIMDHIELPEDVIRIAQLCARFNGEDVSGWVANLIRRHADTDPFPAGPRVIEGEPPRPQLENPDAGSESGTASSTEPATTTPEPPAPPEPKPLEDHALLVRTADEAGLLAEPYVSAVRLRELMHVRHEWASTTHGSRRVAEALRKIGVEKAASPMQLDGSDRKVTAYPTAKMRTYAKRFTAIKSA